jgi:hypothetical protein
MVANQPALRKGTTPYWYVWSTNSIAGDSQSGCNRSNQQAIKSDNRATCVFHIQKLINPIAADEPGSAAANILQKGLGGQFEEIRTMMQYLFQSFNARGDAKPFKDLIQGVGIDEISHVELMTTTINIFLDGSARIPASSLLHCGIQPAKQSATFAT